MPVIPSPQESVLTVTARDTQPLHLDLQAGAPASVRIDVQGMCTCPAGTRRHGSYTDTDFGGR
jgi:hypothetical protein